ncbi:MAG: HEPN domain-containing protein [Candidatus Pacearchaeota archaeon]|nr:HEPN domain-containing protein [Candidatus Pacearchaeota archaeon]
MIDNIISTLPKNKESISKGFCNCRKLKKYILVSKEEFNLHLEKAKSDLSQILVDYENEAWDWVVIKAYYAIHHAINALLIKFQGFYSKDHFCAILALKNFDLVPQNIYENLRKISTKFSDFTGFEISYSLRKIGQYDVTKWKQLSKEDASKIYNFTKEFVSFVEKRCFE